MLQNPIKDCSFKSFLKILSIKNLTLVTNEYEEPYLLTIKSAIMKIKNLYT